MDTLILHLGGLSADQHVAEELDLPVISNLGAVGVCKRAIDAAAMQRRGVAVIGPKGAGKTLGLRMACEWFTDLERSKRAAEEGYRMRRILRLRGLRDSSYRETAVLVAKQVSPHFSDRKKGKKKDQNEIRQELVQLCLKQQIAVIVADEGEIYSDQALLFLRDLMSEAEDEDSNRFKTLGSVGAGGIGVVIVGDETLEKRLVTTNEASERWTKVFTVDGMDSTAVARVYQAWFPAFADHVVRVGEHEWLNYVNSVICRGRKASFRLLENHARTYAHYVFRSRRDITDRADIPFDARLFEHSADEVSWGLGKDSTRAPRRQRRTMRAGAR